MPKKILLIENDAAFAGELSRSLEPRGFDVRITGDGREGLDLAREWQPEAVVLCVELPGMSGYLVCQKLKKDDALKALPLVLTSAEATEETFEKHRTLKARADEYLLKPYGADALVEKLGALIGLPEGGEGAEELVSLEEELGIEASAEGSPDEELSGLDELTDEPASAAPDAPSLDDDLALLDDAFEGIAAPSPAAAGDDAADPADAAAALDELDELTSERPVEGEELEGEELDVATSLPEEDEIAGGRADLAALDDEAEAALGALGDADETLSRPLPQPAAPPAPAPSRGLRGASADLLRRAGIKLLGEDPAKAAAEAPAPAASADVERLEREVEELRKALGERDAEVARLEEKGRELARRAEETAQDLQRAKGQADAAAAQARKAEAEVRRAEEEARSAEAQLAEARRCAEEAEARAEEAEARAEEAEARAAKAEAGARQSREEAAAAADAAARAAKLEREVEDLRTELLVARSEAEGAQAEVEKRTADLRRKLSEIEAASAKNEERVVKAYQKIKADEKVREKVRKAISIAAQLLDEGLPTADAAEKERRAAGRE